MTTRVPDERIAEFRSFNRFWTRQIGVLQAGLLDSPYSLTEVRVLYELAQREVCDAGTLRTLLELDSGYLSRILAGFKDQGLIDSTPSPLDARRQELRLTTGGRAVFADLDRRAQGQVEAVLAGLPDEDQRRLTTSMATIRSILDPESPAQGYVIRPPLPGDLGWVVHRHGVIYAEEYGWDDSFEALVARVVADYVDGHDPRREACWVAERDGVPVGSVFCCRKDGRTAQLRLLLVEPRARGLGIGARLVQECVSFARRAGYRHVVLWTNDVLVSARRIYEAAGFTLTDEEPHHSFGADLVGQHWTLDLD